MNKKIMALALLIGMATGAGSVSAAKADTAVNALPITIQYTASNDQAATQDDPEKDCCKKKDKDKDKANKDQCNISE